MQTFSKEAINDNLLRLINQTYKLLPNREENVDWEKPLLNIVEELLGMKELLVGQQDILFRLSSKLLGLLKLSELQLSSEEEFLLFRGTIFDCLNLLSRIKDNVNIR